MSKNPHKFNAFLPFPSFLLSGITNWLIKPPFFFGKGVCSQIVIYLAPERVKSISFVVSPYFSHPPIAFYFPPYIYYRMSDCLRKEHQLPFMRKDVHLTCSLSGPGEKWSTWPATPQIKTKIFRWCALFSLFIFIVGEKKFSRKGEVT